MANYYLPAPYKEHYEYAKVIERHYSSSRYEPDYVVVFRIRPKEADLIFDFQDGISFCSCKAVVLLVPTHPYPALFVAVYTAAIGVDLYRDCRTTP